MFEVVELLPLGPQLGIFIGAVLVMALTRGWHFTFLHSRYQYCQGHSCWPDIHARHSNSDAGAFRHGPVGLDVVARIINGGVPVGEICGRWLS